MSDCESKKHQQRRRRRNKKNQVSVVQRLYECCKEVFADCDGPGIVPSPHLVEHLAAVLDGMSQADVGLRPSMACFREPPVITYLHLYDCERFSIGIFCLPPTSVIPLHNHPGMTVFSKLLFGTIHIKSYDWSNDVTANPQSIDNDGLRLAKLKVDSEFTAPCSASILYPADGGNMHCFTARTACAVLDVLGPPYCDAEGRHCQYYYDFPLSHFLPQVGKEGGELAWLKERDKPDELCMVRAPYNGPRITET